MVFEQNSVDSSDLIIGDNSSETLGGERTDDVIDAGGGSDSVDGGK